MRLLLQRVSSAGVRVEDEAERPIGRGLVILLGVCPEDDEKTADYMLEKAVGLRIFRDDEGQMNKSLLDIGGDLLLVSNFTLYANSKKGRRPSFTGAAHPSHAEPLYRYMLEKAARLVPGKVAVGEFGAAMQVNIQNDGPVTVWLDSGEIMPKE